MRGIAALAVSLVLAVGFSPSALAAPVPGTSCAVFPSDNVWNMDVSNLPVAAKSKMWKRSANAGSTLLHPDFGGPPYGFPFDVVAGDHPKVSVDFAYAGESDRGPIRSTRARRSRVAPTAMR